MDKAATSRVPTVQEEIVPVTWPEPIAPRWSAVPRTSVPRFAAAALRAGGGDPALCFDDGVVITCDALLEHTELLARRLARLVRPGERVALAIGNRAEFFIGLLAIAAVRAVAVTINPGVGRQDALHMLTDSRSVVALVGDESAPIVLVVAADCPDLRSVVRLEGEEPHGFSGSYDGRRHALDAFDAPPEELLEIGYTSGTTGLPKALAGDHAETLRYVDDFLRIHPFAVGDRMLSPMQFHYGDPVWLFYASLAVGSPLLAMRRFSVSRFWHAARDLGATHICTIGAMPSLLLSATPGPHERDHAVRHALAVGVPAAKHRELTHRFGANWLEVYGSSEAGTVIAMPPHVADEYIGTGALGIPVPHVEVRLVDEASEVIDGPGSGQLEVGGDFRFHGYLDDEDATAEVTDRGWFRTGDLMHRDARGVYYFLGRRKDLIRRGGENIAPAEVEEVLRLHPDVVDAAVVPVADELRGEEGKAYVELRPGRPFDPAALVAFCTERLASFKVPRYFEQRFEPFPRTASQRIPKRQLMIEGEHRLDTAWDREAPT
jgi:crotonobetaine/carnitine-CoA ligase